MGARWSAALAAAVLAAGCSGAVVGSTSAGTGGTGKTTGSTGGLCTNLCTQGHTQCESAQVQTCVQMSSGCLGWSAPVSCGSGQACMGGSCEALGTSSGSTTGGSCTNFCPAAGATHCQGTQVQTCATSQATGCLEYGSAVDCPSGQTCDSSQNACVSATTGGTGGTTGGCVSQCGSVGSSQCVGGQVEICHDVGGGCLNWSTPQSCPSGQICGGSRDSCVQPLATSSSGSAGTVGTTGTGAGTSGGSGTTGGTTGSTCSDQCTEGGTQCDGAQIQTCATGSDGCLEWQTATNCSSGKSCDPVVNGCVATCSVSQTQIDCANAASTIGPCCSGAFSLSGSELCAEELSANNDPDQQCAALAMQSCDEIENLYFTSGQCCCPSGQYCDEETANWTCEPQCSSNSSCAGQSGRTACAPNDDQGALFVGPFVCKADDGQPYHGCTGATETCSSGFNCWGFGAGFEVCTTSCNSDSDCAAPGVVCCDTSASCDNDIESCDGNGACLPCGSF